MSVVIPYRFENDERDRVYRWVLARWTALHPDWEILTPHDGETEGPFSRAVAANRGAEMASGDVLVLADADMAIRHGQADQMIDLLWRDAPWVVGYSLMCHLSEGYSEVVMSGDPDVRLADGLHWTSARPFLRWWSPDSVCGLIAVSRADFHAIGGYDPRYRLWGWEDTSFAYKADTLLGRHVRSEGAGVHIWHPLRPDRKTDEWAEANRALGARYEAAAGDPEAMTSLVRESLGA